MENKIKIFSSENWRDYELLDTGEGEKHFSLSNEFT